MINFNILIFLMQKFVFFVLLPFIVSYHRFEPFSIFSSRNNFTKSLFSHFSSFLTLTAEPPFKCIVTDKISANATEIFTYNVSSLITSDYYLPFKFNFSSLLQNDLELHENTTSKILLSLSVLFELKNNLTQSFIEIKKLKNDTETELYRKYLKERINKSFLVHYIHNMPLSNHLSQMSWSQSHFDDYAISGMYTPKSNFLKMILSTLLKQFNSTLYETWLNSENTNLFFSIYQFVDSRGFFYNKKSYIIPFVDICGFSYEKKDKIYIEKSNDDNVIAVKSMSSYQIGEEFKFHFSDDLSNDNLVLNYGFIDANNTAHSFLINFDIDDPKLKFYKFLHWKQFNMNSVKLNDVDKLNAAFPLTKLSLSSDLISFVFLYSEFSRGDVRIKHNAELNKRFTAFFLYYSTIYKNVLGIVDNIQSVNGYIDELGEIQQKIEKNDKEIEGLNDKGIIDNFENLFYYNQQHDLLNQRNIHMFNLENLILLFKQEEFAYSEVISTQWNIINSKYIKGKYIR